MRACEYHVQCLGHLEKVPVLINKQLIKKIFALFSFSKCGHMLSNHFCIYFSLSNASAADAVHISTIFLSSRQNFISFQGRI